ncbi:MAG: ATP-binding protein [Kiritimatiellae bacterium]|nr:ATP-binding protein [Kiritimatiellia bacterium]
MMIQREIAPWLLSLAEEYPVVSLMGPRQSGKTTLAKALFPSYGYVNLEDPDERRAAESDGAAFMRRHPAPLVIDEVQRVPELLSRIQVAVDADSGRKGAYILTGSHQPTLREGISQTLAGRVALAILMPLSIGEIRSAMALPEREELVFRGFLPRIWAEGLSPATFLSNYIATYVERDVNAVLNLRDRRPFETFLRLVAGRVGQLMKYEAIASEAGVSAATVKAWLSVLEAGFVVFTVPCYHRNFGKRFVKAPKVYFTDVGLCCHLLGIQNPAQVERDPLFGGLFENLVVAEALKRHLNRGLEPHLHFVRDYKGFEVDLLVENGRTLDLYEIKSSMSFHESFAENVAKLAALVPNAGRTAVVYSGRPAAAHGIDYVNYADFAP